MKRGQVKETQYHRQGDTPPPWPPCDHLMNTASARWGPQEGPCFLPSHAHAVQAHPTGSSSWACPRLAWSWAHQSQRKDSQWLQWWGPHTLRQMWESKMWAGLWFQCCVHRMSSSPHEGRLATLPTSLVLSVQHCTWSYLPFTRELI